MQWKIILILVLGLLIAGGTKIFAQEQEPVLSLACEGKSGLLTGVDDGWSIKSECRGAGQRLVRLGNQGPNGTGNILFIYKASGDWIYALKADGKIYGSNGGGWLPGNVPYTGYPSALPAEVPPTSVAQWMFDRLLDKDGNVWWYPWNGPWRNIGHPQ